MFLNNFPKYLLVTPEENSKSGWSDLSRKLPDPQKVGRAVYFTPNGFETLSREESDVTQFNSVYIDIDCPKGSTAEEIDSFVKKRVSDVFTTLEPSFIVRTKNGIHCHWLLTEPLKVTEESKADYIYVLDSIVKHFDADVGAKGINRVLRVPWFYHYKDINDPYLVHLIHEEPENTYTLDEIAKAIGVEYPQAVESSTPVAEAGEFDGDIDIILTKMLKRENSRKVYEGDVSDYNDNTSSADLALCNHLAFWFGKDREVMRSVWLASPLGQREKTQKRVDYQNRTLDEAISNCENVYTPKLPTKVVESDISIPERDEYLAFLQVVNWDDKDDMKKLKRLLAQYVDYFYKYLAIKYPHLLFEIGEDKSYWNYNSDEGLYESVNHSVVRGMVIDLLVDEELTSRATDLTAKQVLHKYRAKFPTRGVTMDSFVSPDNVLHVKNGWLNLKTLELTEHSPEKLSLFKMGVDYDRDAECPLYDKFLDVDTRMPEDQVRVIDQFSGYVLTSGIEQQQCLIMEGTPGCGKSMLPEIWLEVLGSKGTTASLKSLSGSEIRFMGDVFSHKNLCFFDEANPRTDTLSEYFQNMITKPYISVERKGIQERVDVRNSLKIVLTLNEMPDHMPPGMDRRMRHIMFTRSFDDDGTADKDYKKKVIAAELSGVLNRMLAGLQDYWKMGGLTTVMGEAERKKQYVLAADDFSAFIHDNFEPVRSSDKEVRYSAKEFKGAFLNQFSKPYHKQLSTRGFNKKLFAIRLPEFKHIKHNKSNGKWGYQGLELKTGKSFVDDGMGSYKIKDEFSYDGNYQIDDDY